MKKIISISILALSFLFSCKKKAEETPKASIKTSSISIQFETRAGDDRFVIGQNYVNSSNETFNVNLLRYYVSNLVLRKPDGSATKLSDTYFLIDAEGRETITVPNVPEGNYSGLSFLIGVDSAKTKSGVQTGDLDVTKGMFWNSWGVYINFMMNGNSPSAKNASKAFMYHIGGYDRHYAALQTVSTDFGILLMVKQNAVSQVHYFVDILKVFNPNIISIAKTPVWEDTGDTSRMISENYKNMFQLSHIHN
jgi:hypothetical protein